MIIELCYVNPHNNMTLYENKEIVAEKENIAVEKVQPIYILCYSDGDYMGDNISAEGIVRDYFAMKKVILSEKDKKLELNENAKNDKVLLDILNRYNLI